MKDARGHGSNSGGGSGFFGEVVKPLWQAVTNRSAAAALASGPKSAPVPVHRSMLGARAHDQFDDISERSRRIAGALM